MQTYSRTSPSEAPNYCYYDDDAGDYSVIINMFIILVVIIRLLERIQKVTKVVFREGGGGEDGRASSMGSPYFLHTCSYTSHSEPAYLPIRARWTNMTRILILVIVILIIITMAGTNTTAILVIANLYVLFYCDGNPHVVRGASRRSSPVPPASSGSDLRRERSRHGNSRKKLGFRT